MELSFSTSFAPDAKKGGSKLPTYDLPPGCSVAPGYQKKTKKRPGKVETNTTHMFVCEDAKDE